MKKIVRIMLFLIILIINLCFYGCNTTTKKHYNEWVEENGNQYYYNSEGTKQTGWIHDKSDWYYLNPQDGRMLKKQWVDNYKYYVDEQGRMLTNTKKEINGTTYEFDTNGFAKEFFPCQLIIDCQFPKTFKYKGVGYWYETIIENVEYEMKWDEYLSGYVVSIYFTGTAGNSSTVTTFQSPRAVDFKIYNSNNNNEAYYGEFITRDSLKFGEKFVHNSWEQNGKNKFYLKRNEVYRLELFDVDHDWLSMWRY